MNRRHLHAAVLAAIFIAHPAVAQPARPVVQLGVDTLIERRFEPLVGKRVGLITNPTGVTGDLRATIDVLAKADGVKLVALFGPEHGVRGSVPAGEKINDARDEATGLPVYSLYGATRKATPAMLEAIDVLVFDVQDIGSRSYTYISSMALAMEAAAEQRIPFVVLDRPNPLNGERIEGRPLDPKFTSFVGQLPIPYVHGMTVGELAQMINGEGWLGDLQKRRETPTDGKLKCELTVVPMRGWRRSMLWSDTGLTWTQTSPHIPRADSALFYAATGIIGEPDTLSVGVGYTLPFELIGHPSLRAEPLADDLNARRLPGVRFRPVYFQPFYARHEKKHCGGVQIMLTDPRVAELTAIQFHALDAIRRQNPSLELINEKRADMFDKVCGTDGMRKRIARGAPIDEVLAYWREGVADFRAKRKGYLLYE